jgi:hypothetical protein
VSEERRLRDKLAKLAAEDGRDAPRRLVPGPDGDMRRPILEEIDETILARTIVLRAPDGDALTLEVVNRRLLGITGYPEELASGDEREKLLAPLAPDDEETLAAVAEALARFAVDHAVLSVSTRPLSRGAGPGTLGRSAAAVARALGLALYDRPEPVAMPDPSAGFDAGLARLSLAVAHLSGAEPAPARGPDSDAVERLSGLGREELSGLLGQLGPEAARPGRFLMLSGGDETLFVGQQDAERALAALLPQPHAGAVAALWRATRGA